MPFGQAATQVSGPRLNPSCDVSYFIYYETRGWASDGPDDFEQAVALSKWRPTSERAGREFHTLMTCTDISAQEQMLLRGRKFREKNRYSDILAFKHTRVHLVPLESEYEYEEDAQVADYINANFIDGPLGELNNRKIIGCQGPKPNTVSDMWRMIA